MPEVQPPIDQPPAAGRRPDFGAGEPAAPPVVFVPGLNNSSSVWREVIDALPDPLAGVAVDCPPLDDVDAVAKALLAELPDRFVAVGHSFGGYVALAMLAAEPHRLAGLALVNSSDDADTPEQAAARLARADEARTGDYEAMAMAGVALAYHPDHAGDERLLAARRAGVRQYGRERFIAHCTACSRRPGRRRLLAATPVPVLVVAADTDQVIPPARQRAMAEGTGALFRTVVGAGHMLPAEQPRALARVLTDWVTRYCLPRHPAEIS